MPNAVGRSKRKRVSSSCSNRKENASDDDRDHYAVQAVGNQRSAKGGITASDDHDRYHDEDALRTTSPRNINNASDPHVNPFNLIYGHMNRHRGVDDGVPPSGNGTNPSGGGDVVLDQVVAFMECSKLPKHEKQIQKENLRRITRQLLHHMSPLGSSWATTNDSEHPHQESGRTSGNKKRKLPTQERVSRNASFAPSSSLVTGADVGRLLLPWAIKGILRCDYQRDRHQSNGSPQGVGDDDDDYWTALRSCLEFFSPPSPSESSSSSSTSSIGSSAVDESITGWPTATVTLSTMHKIVPIALKTALLPRKDDDFDLGSAAVSVPILARDCYRRFVQHFYRPPFDTLCDCLLPRLIAEDTDRGNHDGRGERKGDPIWYQVAAPTLQLMCSRLAKANPKRSFQLLVRPKTFLALAKIHHRCGGTSRMGVSPPEVPEKAAAFDGLVQLVGEGLFSVEHHLNGYRSLKLGVPTTIGGAGAWGGNSDSAVKVSPQSDGTKRADLDPPASKSHFQCYQEGLLVTLRGCLFPSDSGSDDGFSSWEVSQAAELVPLLLKIFLGRTSRMQPRQLTDDPKQHKQSKKNKAGDYVGQLQFSFVACFTGLLLSRLREGAKNVRMNVQMEGESGQQHEKSSISISLLTSVARILEDLLEHNVYQPSMDDTKESAFLDLIGRDIAAMMSSMLPSSGSETTSTCLSACEWRKTLKILDVLTRLNHTTLRARLPALLVGICANRTDEAARGVQPQISSEASTFLATIVSTYSKLRQLDFFYRSLIESVSTMLKNQDTDSLHGLMAFLDDDKILACLGRATQESPIQQLKQVFHIMSITIVELSSEKMPFESPGAATAVSVLTITLTGLLQHVRVDGSTAGEIHGVCIDVMNGPLKWLAEVGTSHVSKTSPLSTKRSGILLCAWTMNLKHRCEFWASEKTWESTGSPHWEVPASILQMLEISVYHVSHRAGGSGIDDDGLVGALSFLACQMINGLYGTIHKKQCISFATDDEEYGIQDELSQVRQLVRFVLRVGARDNYDSSAPSKQNWVVLARSIPTWAPCAEPTDIDSFLTPFLHVVADPESNIQDRCDMLGILHDASFYEIPTMSRRLGTNVASLVAITIQNALQASVNPSNEFLHSQWATLSPEEVDRMCAKISTPIFSSEHIHHVKIKLNKCALILEVVNGVRIPIWEECEEGILVAESVLRLECLCFPMLAETGGDLNDVVIRLVNSFWQTLARVLTSLSQKDFQQWAGPKNERVVLLLSGILRKSAKLLGYFPMETVLQHDTLDSCKTITGSLLKKMLSNSELPQNEMCRVLESLYFADKDELQNEHFVVLANFACKLLNVYGTEGDCPPSNVARHNVFRTVEKLLWRDAVKRFDQPGTSQMVQAQCTRFFADMLEASAAIPGDQETKRGSVESNILQMVKAYIKRTKAKLDTELRPFAYLISVLARVRPTAVQEFGLELMLLGNNDGLLFKTPFWAIFTRCMDSEELIKYFDHLLGQKSDERIETQLNVTHALILSLTDPTQVDVFRNYSRQVFNVCLKAMAQSGFTLEVNDRTFHRASSLMTDMASRKEIFAFRERDIAVVLAHTSAVMRMITANDAKSTMGARVNVFEAIFSLLSSILQRFTKQAHSCVPSVVITLTVMLDFSLHCSLPETEAMACGQKFSRLCELLLPHGEVYKKHILCLIVRFVDALGGELESARKKSLLPAIYCLLDVIQQHEIMQLNSMLDEMGRALLRSVHEGYKKVHIYSGQ
jgi:Urb2/Npa2 family